MKHINWFALLLVLITSCNANKNWEYKVVYFDASKIKSEDKNYTNMFGTFESNISCKSVLPSEQELNKLGNQGWEISTSYLEMETVFPNLLASGSGVNGLQPNVRPQRLVVILKRNKK
jgi:hypothetical protein